MSFTIKCNECGNEQIFTDGMSRWAENIELDVYVSTDFVGATVESITIYCENRKCNKYIDVKF
ncbi:hypothetical protein Gp_84 [Bacillus phage vB_Bacillus_1020A]|uniref:hypothetical protein n=1 Tax=Robertmurraya sp. DFI.2.37 TaxID=3031819 RepID=UPI00124598B3|nr:hypothetical protein [Robertmurraya sp. DFI.2.37]MDF1511472.1 hypothetical protein [Robertmurraya sp. DFI.2.37]QIW89358.1 hypothetical protein Gp_84 [Bacillus phage vB_Bacillus_1020A]